MTEIDTSNPLSTTTSPPTVAPTEPVVIASSDLPTGGVFPEQDDFLGSGPSRSGGRRVRLAVAAGVVALLLVVGVTVRSAAGSSAASYRTATVGRQSVSQTLDAVATVAPVDQASVAFPVSGTVATVDVQVGDEVTVGQTLATLDTASLLMAINESQAALDQANLSLYQALNGETVTGGSGASGGSGGLGGNGDTGGSDDTSPVSDTAAGDLDAASAVYLTDDSITSTTAVSAAAVGDPGGGPTTGLPTDLAGAQQAVLAAQKRVDESMVAAQAALANANQICLNTADATAIAACQSALQEVMVAQQDLADDQDALDAAVQNVTTVLEASAAQGGTGGTGNSDGSAGGDGTTGGSGDTGSTGTDAQSSSSTSAADLVAYQKAVDAAELDLAVANQALAQATIVSSIDGTVVDVNLAVGDSVSSGSTTANIVVVGDGGFELTTYVSVVDLSDVEVGQDVVITPDATGTPVAGAVVGIGVLASDGTNYPVVIGITGDATGLRNGSVASVAIITDDAVDGLAVPTSAITTDGTRHTVTVLDGDTASVVDVGIGAIGPTWTEVTSGLDEGQEVVLADLRSPLPGSATDSSNSDSGSTRQFPGGSTGGPSFTSGGGPQMVGGPPGG